LTTHEKGWAVIHREALMARALTPAKSLQLR
jgi:hypothetical protein